MFALGQLELALRENSRLIQRSRPLQVRICKLIVGLSLRIGSGRLGLLLIVTVGGTQRDFIDRNTSIPTERVSRSCSGGGNPPTELYLPQVRKVTH